MFTKASHVLFAIAIGAVANACNAQSMYTVTEIGGVSAGNFYRAFGINNAGQVVGQYETGDFGVSRAFLYSNGVLTDLGTLGGSSSVALAINNSGVIVGASQSNTGLQAFVYTAGAGMTNISPPGYGSIALGVSDSGLVVGSYWNGNIGPWGFTYQNGTSLSPPNTTTINGVFGTIIPTAANASGVTVGKVIDPSNQFVGQPYIANGQQGNVLPGVPGYSSSRASGINAAGDVIGFTDNGNSQSFLYSKGKMTLLGSLGGTFSGGVQVYGINSQDAVVGIAYNKNTEAWGYSNTPESSLDYHVLGGYMTTGSHAVIYRDGVLQDLNDLIDPSLGWELLDARSINDSGQIVGEGVINGHIHAFILTPVPEPSVRSEMLLGFGFLLASLGAKRRRFN